MASKEQVIKTRDDYTPIRIERIPGAEAEGPQFTVLDAQASSWARKGDKVGVEQLRPRVEPWLTSLFQSDHLGLLIGSGLTHAVHGIAVGGPLKGMQQATFGEFSPTIDAEVGRVAAATGRGSGNYEDQARVASELLRGLEILAATDPTFKPKTDALRGTIEQTLLGFAQSILEGENAIVLADEKKRESAFTYLVSFLMSFGSRTGTRDRLQIFTTNYDRLIEAGAEFAGLHLLDRFVGTISPILRASRLDVDLHYNPPGIRGEPRYLEGVARFTKLHGSVDWVDTGRTIQRIGLPFGAKSSAPFLNSPALSGVGARELIIYPNSAKDRETAAFPYVELFRDLAAGLCRPNCTLVTYGYSFGDDHINRVIADMLTIPSTHLVVIAYDDPLGRISQAFEKLGRRQQVTLLLGDHFGDLRQLVDNYLPKPAIDRSTFRMAELLKNRWQGAKSGESQVGSDQPSGNP